MRTDSVLVVDRRVTRLPHCTCASSDESFHIVIARGSPLGRRSRKFGRGNSREQSCAGGTAQWRGLRGARSPSIRCGGAVQGDAVARGRSGRRLGVKRPCAARFTRRGDVGTSHPTGPQGAANPPDPVAEHPVSPAQGPCFGQKPARSEGFRGHRRVAGWLRRVVVARRCTQHHLQRVMVETPPRAGPSPPHGPARFFFPAGRLEPPAGTVRSAPVGGPRPQRG
jgi:hypothetical protein